MFTQVLGFKTKLIDFTMNCNKFAHLSKQFLGEELTPNFESPSVKLVYLFAKKMRILCLRQLALKTT